MHELRAPRRLGSTSLTNLAPRAQCTHETTLSAIAPLPRRMDSRDLRQESRVEYSIGSGKSLDIFAHVGWTAAEHTALQRVLSALCHFFKGWKKGGER